MCFSHTALRDGAFAAMIATFNSAADMITILPRIYEKSGLTANSWRTMRRRQDTITAMLPTETTAITPRRRERLACMFHRGRMGRERMMKSVRMFCKDP